MSEMKFGDAPSSAQQQYVKTAGIHLNFSLTGREFIERITKDDKEKNAYVKLTFTGNDEKKESFLCMLFEPATKESEVKYLGDIYEKGVKIRKRTPEEQIKQEHGDRFYFYEQLAKALQQPAEKVAKWKQGLTGTPEVMFKMMFESFFNNFPLDSVKDKKMNFKMMWSNNDKNKTSFLGLCSAAQNNIVFAAYVSPETTGLQLSAYEEKNLHRKYQPKVAAPKSDATEIINESNDAWEAPTTNDGAPAQELF